MDISIRTAQHVNIVYQPAGLVNRIGATLIDLAFLGGIYILCFTLASLSSIFRNTTTAIILLVILMCYHFVCEYFFHGRSLGKLTLHLRVVRLDGRKLSFWNCLLRWILRLVDISASMGILAMLSIIISSKMQRLGDLAAGTTVIHEKKDTDLRRISFFETPESYKPTFHVYKYHKFYELLSFDQTPISNSKKIPIRRNRFPKYVYLHNLIKI